MRWLLTLFLITLLALSLLQSVHGQDELDEFENEDEDDEPEPIAKRQFNAVRETFKSVVGAPAKFLTNGRLIRGIQVAIQSQRGNKPGATSNTATANSASNILATLYRTMRSHWAKQSADASSALRKQLQTITKRLSNSKIIIGNVVGTHKLSNREESATKEATAEVAPTAESKTTSSSTQQPAQPVAHPHHVHPSYNPYVVPQQYYHPDQMLYQVPIYPEPAFV